MTWWSDPLRSVVEGRRVVLVGGVPSGWSPTVDAVQAAGADAVMIAATEGRGVGAAPDVPTWCGERPAGDTMRILRGGLQAVREPPPALLAAVDEFDPDGTAVVIGTFLVDAPELAGRPLLAYRRPEWLALEDKVVADALWDRSGVARLPSLVVAVEAAASAAPSIDRGDGTVWAADARDGFHGAATLTRWVTDVDEANSATAALAPHCDRVRIMPFVEGIPCSVHGIVLPDGAVALRPVEMVTLRRGHELVYSGCATFWDPPPAARDQMRGAARAVGERLRAEVDFRGTFTIDGVVGIDGFWPTELNPRFGAGLVTVARGLGNVPLTLVNDLVVAGIALDVTAAALEAEILAGADADAQRYGGTWRNCAPTVVETAGAELVVDDDGAFRRAREGDACDASVHSGSSFARATFTTARTPVGESVGARACSFWAFAEREMAAGPATYTPARDVTA